MNEAETRAKHIDPALKAAGWGVAEGSKILREYPITLGRIEGHGRRGKPLTADYVLVYRDRFAAVPFEDKGGSHPSRYYQDIAVERVMEAIAAHQTHVLLTLATGTGKTFIAFQIAWKLFHSRWNLSREPSRRPRILFLADRNIFANQAYNAFSAFAEDAMVRIEPEDIRKKGKVPKNGSLFFTIFQTFMSGPPKDGKPSPYFGEPVCIYSLKEGINDGFLTPFKVKQISTTLDEYVYAPDDQLIEGEIETGKRYTETDFNKIIEIKEQEAHRVKLFMEQINQNEKTLVFCATSSQ